MHGVAGFWSVLPVYKEVIKGYNLCVPRSCWSEADVFF